MKNFSRLMTSAVALTAFAGASAAYAADTATGIANVNIVAAESITAVNEMEFGTVTIGTTNGTVVIDPNSGVNATNVTQVGTPEAGTFQVTSTDNNALTFTVGAVADIGGVSLSDFTVAFENAANTPATLNGAVLAAGDNDGDVDMFVGATLGVPTTATDGPKQFSYDVTVAYE